MPEYLAPGVYLEEFEIGAKPIEGVSTCTLGIIGVTERGPMSPKFVSNFEDYRRAFGDYLKHSYLPNALEGFFANGGKRCYVARVVRDDAKTAFMGSAGGGTGAGQGGSEESEELNKAREKLTALKKELKGLKGQERTPKEEEINTQNQIIKNLEKPADTTAVPGTQSSTLPFEITASGPGKWGDNIAIKIEEAGLHLMNDTLFKMTIAYWREKPADDDINKLMDNGSYKKDGKDKDIDLLHRNAKDIKQPDRLEVYDNLTADVLSSDNYQKRISGVSVLVDIKQVTDGKKPENMTLTFLTGGDNGTPAEGDQPTEDGFIKPKIQDYKGNKNFNNKESGLLGFEQVDDISIVLAPDECKYYADGKGMLTQEIVIYYETMKDRFAILQCTEKVANSSELVPPVDSKCAAFYFPWIYVVDPMTQRKKLIPPGGHVAGIYARSDTERGVHKAPANEVVRGALELQMPIGKGIQDVLNPRGVNCIRTLPGRGIRVWGARTASSDPIWKYINVRRLFLYIGESIEQGTQWVVFEPSNERLWARVKQTITQFLTGVWRSGALMGSTADEAFFVRCDRSTMTQDDIDNGRLVCIIGVAATKPAEFVILRVAQWQGGSAATE